MLSPAQRSLRARIAALHLHAGVDGRAHTEKARAAGPGQLAYWERKVDPDRALPEGERHRRAEAAKRAHFLALALKSAKARSKKATEDEAVA